jgi:8-oxo-dGTP diphosphatase
MNDTERYIVNVEVAIVHDARYLMLVRSEREVHAPGVLCLPGGKVENAGFSDNVLEGTARREAREEAGVEIGDQIVYVESKSFTSDDGEPVVDIVYLARYQSGEPRPGDPAEVAGLEWLTAAEVLAHPKAPPWIAEGFRKIESRRVGLGW